MILNNDVLESLFKMIKLEGKLSLMMLELLRLKSVYKEDIALC